MEAEAVSRSAGVKRKEHLISACTAEAGNPRRQESSLPGRGRKSRQSLGGGESPGCLRAKTFHEGDKSLTIVSLELFRLLKERNIFGSLGRVGRNLG
jgi:hypothetical protein